MDINMFIKNKLTEISPYPFHAYCPLVLKFPKKFYLLFPPFMLHSYTSRKDFLLPLQEVYCIILGIVM